MKPLRLVSCCAPEGKAMTDAEAAELERLFSAVADRHRVKIISLLTRAGCDAVCVCDVEAEVGLAQPTVSYHLKKLLDAGLLEREKRGTYGYYSLAPGALDRLRAAFADAVPA